MNTNSSFALDNTFNSIAERDVSFQACILGKPIPLQRPMFRFRGRGTQVSLRPYNPTMAKLLQFRRLITQVVAPDPQEAGNDAAPPVPPFPLFSRSIPLVVHVTFFMRRPLTHFSSRGDRNSGVRARYINALPVCRPDLDNLVKFLLDGLEGGVYGNDCSIVRIVASKRYDDRRDCAGRIEVRVVKAVAMSNAIM